MKKLVAACAVVTVLIGLVGADIRREQPSFEVPKKSKKPCYGYTIVEFGKGINCHGDTVTLQKVSGGQQLAGT